MVYVLSKNGQSIMPTKNHAKVRLLLNYGKAKVVRRTPFTIQLTGVSKTYIQDVTLGVDAGSKKIGLSATTTKKVLFEAEVTLRNDIVDLLSSRRELRRSRRNRKTRYRKARFLNRVKSKKAGWLAPSVKHKVESHLTMVAKVHKILPISKIIVEVASFDIQKIKNPDISGVEYQQGEQLNFWNVREYVLFRDNHQCQCCKGKSKDKVLNVHHIESRKTGGNAPNNLITLCESCHTKYHKGEIKLPAKIKRGMSFRDATFMGIMRWAFYNKLKELYQNVSLTYGYITKNTRIKNNLPKEHYIDARCISGNPLVIVTGEVFYYRKVRCHNRQIHKVNFIKGGIRKRNQAPYVVKEFRLYDYVQWKGAKCFIFGRRTTGRMDLRLLDGTHINASVGFKNIKLLSMRKNYLCEQRKVV